MIEYEIRQVTTNDSEWRGKFDPFLTPIARQGGTAVWSADAVTTLELLNFWQIHPSCVIFDAPRIVTPAEGEVHFEHGEVVSYVAHLERVADGPVNKATKLAFKPHVDKINTGIRARLSSGTLDDQGLRAHLLIDRDRIMSFQTSTYSETVTGTKLAHSNPAKLNATIQIPVVDSAKVDGEWVIPKEGALIVSLGTSRSKGKLIREIMPEELVVIRYRPAPGQSPTPIVPVQTTAVPKRSLKGPAAN